MRANGRILYLTHAKLISCIQGELKMNLDVNERVEGAGKGGGLQGERENMGGKPL